jgi:hypothetical protein
MSMVLLAVVAACGGGSPAATGTPPPATAVAPQASHAAAPTQAPANPTPAPVQSTPAVVGSSGVVVHVVVGSGPQAGTYDSTGAKEDCNTSPTGSGATYADATKTDGVTTLLFTADQGGANPTGFEITVSFGAIAVHQPFVEINTNSSTPDGTGTATLEDNGATIKWTINGTTQDGVSVMATIECGPVDRRTV